MSEYLLEILLPFHKVNEHLLEAIESCLEALPSNSRIIAINTSNDRSCLVLDSKSVLHLNLASATYIEALRYGLKFSSAEYVGLMNSDDIVDSSRFRNQIMVLEQTRNSLCVSDLQKFTVTKKGKTKYIPAMLGKPPRDFHEALLLLGSYRADATWCFRRSWAVEEKLFEFPSDSSDWSTALRVMRKRNTVIINQPLYFYRMHSDQFTRLSKDKAPITFYNQWNFINQQYGFTELSKEEIQTVALPWENVNGQDIRKILFWLGEIENFLITKLPKSDKKRINNIISRRRIMISISHRIVGIKFRDFHILPKLLFEFSKSKQLIRFNLK